MRVILKAILKEVEAIQEKGDLKFQYVLFEKPVYDQFEGSLIRTDYFPATIFNDNIEKLDTVLLLGKKVEATCYLNSQEAKNDDKTFYNLRLKVASMKELVIDNPHPITT